MPYRANYPATVNEVLNDRATYNPAALRAVREFARSKPWRGSHTARVVKFQTLHRALSNAYAIVQPELRFEPLNRGSSYYQPGTNAIVLCGRLSVVTYLHEFGHARGFDERQTCRWSINLFRRCFPRSYASCRHDGHMLVSNSNHSNNEGSI